MPYMYGTASYKFCSFQAIAVVAVFDYTHSEHERLL